ncbi:MAG: outer membrane beta-barrel protein [Gemmatimonadaceae bacterium]|nr:outer membrane beta-barrel protein [Gemmatimonadaceae bacterium]
MQSACRLLLGGVLCASASLLTARPVAAQSLGYVLMPSAQRVQWDDDLAFDDDWLYGGRLGLLFGRHVELQPYYYYKNKFPIDASRADASFGPLAQGRSVDIKNFGVNLQFNLGRGDVVPFLKAGGGILRFEPDSGDKRDRVAVSAGGGIRFNLGGLQAELFGEQMAFRLNPRNIFGVETPTGERAPSQVNIVYGAALSIPLSKFDDAALDAPLSGSTAPIEPFVGRLRYASEQKLDDQELAGVRAGVDLTSQVGLRGFYWRGVNDDRDGTAPVAGYGGEAQFNLNTGPGIAPFLVVGAGRIDYLDSFRDRDSLSRDDQNFLILGGGASIRLSDRIRLNAAVRDYVMTAEPKLTDVASTDDLTHNTMISAGLTISLGGESATARREAEARRDRMEAERQRTRDLERERELDRYRDATAERARRDTIMRDREPRVAMDRAGDTTMMRMRRPMAMQGGDSTMRWVTVPVPAVGEVILRYGMTSPGTGATTTTGLPIEELRRIIREELQRQPTSGARAAPDTTIIRREAMPGATSGQEMVARLAEMERRLTARMADLEAARSVPAMPAQVVVVDTTTGAQQLAAVPVFQRIGRTGSQDLRPFVGFGGGDGSQVVASLRADLGPLQPGSGFRFVPELAVGFGSGSPTVLALANVQYPFGSMMGSRTLQPYVTLGAGIFSKTILAVNTAVGASFNVRAAGMSPLYTYMELQGLNLYDYTRLMVGVTNRR